MGEEVEPVSPEKRLKFLCSFGGKILPRPSDGHLKYVGGDTRVFVFPRSVSFSDLIEKLASVQDTEFTIKYKLITEDLDALVTVKSDADVRHMIDEYDHHGPSPRFRVFLFPAKASTITKHDDRGLDRLTTLQQRYIDAVNAVHVHVNPSSTSSSPTSTTTADSTAFDFAGAMSSRLQKAIHKAHSSPNLCMTGRQAATALPAVAPHQRHYHHQHSRLQKLWQNPTAGPLWRMGSGPLSTAGRCGMNPVSNPRHLSKTFYGHESASASRPHSYCFGHVEELSSCCCQRF